MADDQRNNNNTATTTGEEEDPMNPDLESEDEREEPASLTLGRSSYLRTIPEDQVNDDESVGGPAAGNGDGIEPGGIGIFNAASLAARRGPTGGGGTGGEYPSSLNSEAASSTRAMVLDDDEGNESDVAAIGTGATATSASAVESSNVPTTLSSGNEAVLAAGIGAASATAAGTATGAGAGVGDSSGPHGRNLLLGAGSTSASALCPKARIDLKNRKTRRILYFSVGLTVLIIIAVALVSIFLNTPDPDSESSIAATTIVPTIIGGTNDGDEPFPIMPSPASSGSEGVDENRSSQMTMQPSASPATVAELDEILMTVSYPITFMDDATPQSMAREWMIKRDLLLYDVLDDGPQRTAQRYACAELIYALVSRDERRWMRRNRRRNQIRRHQRQLPARGINEEESEYYDFNDDGQEVDYGGRRRRRRRNRRRKRQRQRELHVDEIPGFWIDGNNEDNVYFDEEAVFFDGGPHRHDVSYYLIPDQEECEWPGFSCDKGMEGHAVTQINLTLSGLMGSLPREIKNLTYLQELDLSRNYILGDLPDWFPQPSVDNGDGIGGNDFDYAPLQYLYLLDLSDNQLSGQINRRLWDLPQLRFLYLQNNEFAEEIKLPFGKDPSLVIDIDDDENGNEPLFQDVWLYNNSLTGTFPSWMLTEFLHLESLVISNNTFAGPLPSLLLKGYPTNLTYLDAAFNQFTGTLPSPLLTSIPSLQSLYVEGNLLTGTLPSTNTNVEQPNFHNVLLHDNGFSGLLPENFGVEWTELRQLTLFGNNNLVGVIGQEQCRAWTFIDVLMTDCGGGIACACCTGCG